jgi:small subunit ribosomal protein S8
MLTRLRNSIMSRSHKVEVIHTKLNLGIVEILKNEGFIDSFEESDNSYSVPGCNSVRKYITITLRYKGSKQIPYITELKRISKPGLRVYVSYKKIPKILGGIGLAVYAA